MSYSRTLILLLVLCWRFSLAQTDSLIHSGYHIDRAKILADSGLYELAIKEFHHIDPRDTNYIFSLVELADIYYSNKQFDSAIETSAKGLLQPSRYRSQLLAIQGMSYAEKAQYDQASTIFETGLKEFPFYPTFSIQYGKMLYTQKRYVEAEKYFFQAIATSPFNLTSHLYLGFIAMLKGEKTRGMMAMGIYMALNNSDNGRLVTLERFVKNELTDEFSIPPSSVNPFARLDEIIRSKIAMDNRYKTEVPIDIGIVRQYQLLFDQIALQEFAGTDLWLSVYLPTYKSLIKASVQDAFLYHILKSTSIETVPVWLKKNEKILKQFYTAINTAIPLVRAKKQLPESWGYREPVSCWYDEDNRLEAIGQENNKNERTGEWYYFFDNGVIKAHGIFDEHGNKKGLWKYFSSSGLQSDIENFDTGERIHFDEQGIMKQKYFLKNGQVEGDLFNYHMCGSVRERLRYRQGLLDGPGEIYSIQGTIVEKLTYERDTLQGKFQAFFNTGELRQESTYVKGKLDKTFTLFHQNGRIASQGEYALGKAKGPWKIYHENGNLKEVGQYNEDLPVGKFTFYDRSGTITEIRNYNEKGQYHGENVYYQNGFLHYTLNYLNGRLVESTYYNKQGKSFANTVEDNNIFKGMGYFPTGELRSEFQYVDGKATGIWSYYSRTGNLESTNEYKDDKLNGNVINYYPDKTKKEISHYQDGKLDGPYEVFYENGQLRTKGWYQNGQLQQQWVSFHPNGKMKINEYYLNDLQTGESFYYDPEGKIISITEYQRGKIVSVRYYNEKGEANSTLSTAADGHMTVSTRFRSGVELLHSEFLCGDYHGKVITHLPDGKPYLVRSYANGKQNGGYQNFFPDGRMECAGTYVDGNATGKYSWFYPNQSLETTGNYVDDERDSLWTYNYENGKCSFLIGFQKGKKHGLTRIFGLDGQLIAEKLYDEGDLISYRFPSKKDTTWTSFKGTGTIRWHYPSGQLAYEESYVNGQLDGARKFYFANGALYILDNYSKGLFEGASQISYQDGKVRVKKNFKMDEPTGRWEYFGTEGKLERVENYLEGQLHGPTEFFSNGKKVKTVNFWYGIPTD